MGECVHLLFILGHCSHGVVLNLNSQPTFITIDIHVTCVEKKKVSVCVNGYLTTESYLVQPVRSHRIAGHNDTTARILYRLLVVTEHDVPLVVVMETQHCMLKQSVDTTYLSCTCLVLHFVYIDVLIGNVFCMRK